jgi:fengycin family lipopeptide synthetase D
MEQLLATPNGKVDRKALAAMKAADVEGAARSQNDGPRTTVELVMLQIWRRVLGMDLGMHDNFFDLGGHSLKAVALRHAIREQLGVDIPLATFFAEATPASLCEWVQGRGAGMVQGSLLTLTQAPSDEPALVLVHEVSGGVLEYLDLCREMTPRGVTVCGLVAPGYDNDEQPLESVQGLAERYVAELIASDVLQPYRLVGWSFGGLVAFEMARRLEERGRNVDLVALLDAQLFEDGIEAQERGGRTDAIVQMSERLDIDLSSAQDDSAEALFALLKTEVVRRGLVTAALADEVLGRQLRVLEAHAGAIARYRASGPVRADVVLFEALERDAPTRIDADAWARRTLGAFRARTVPGSHLTMVRPPHVAALAQALMDELSVSKRRRS